MTGRNPFLGTDDKGKEVPALREECQLEQRGHLVDDQEKSEEVSRTLSQLELERTDDDDEGERARQMEAARRVMKEYEDTLRKLADS